MEETHSLSEGRSIKSGEDDILKILQGTLSEEKTRAILSVLPEEYIREYKETQRHHIECSQDSAKKLKLKRGRVTESELIKFTDSPTASRYLAALRSYSSGWQCLSKINTSQMKTMEVADSFQFIINGIHSFARGRLLEQHIRWQFPFDFRYVVNWIEGYLHFSPNDALAEFLKVVYQIDLLNTGVAGKANDFEVSKESILSLELFAQKIEASNGGKNEQCILAEVYHILGALYSVTNQTSRALHMFQLAYKLDMNDMHAMYAVAYHCIDTEPEQAKEYLMRYLAKAPPCHVKFAEANYLLGIYYLKHQNSLEEAEKYHALGKAAEKNLLPCDQVQSSANEAFLQCMISIAKDVPTIARLIIKNMQLGPKCVAV
ncbi:hypothetical protein MAR_006246 [Mya arenaria]|uniref:Tetratricopeptide repeat protein n=1 Tax=Mya arenaria TaxID=6604 RepID=A0ABY7DBN5_MYAAR|nr:uncharacterized protein LOC128205944 [Mya arenaria]WAQ93775.1 hypothetical protein MAR_006246 [Mya arenaria]